VLLHRISAGDRVVYRFDNEAVYLFAIGGRYDGGVVYFALFPIIKFKFGLIYYDDKNYV